MLIMYVINAICQLYDSDLQIIESRPGKLVIDIMSNDPHLQCTLIDSDQLPGILGTVYICWRGTMEPSSSQGRDIVSVCVNRLIIDC